MEVTPAPAPPGVGTADNADGLLLNDSDLRRRLDQAERGNRRDALKIWNDYKALVIRNPYEDRLTFDQSSRYHYIDVMERWTRIAPLFTAEVEEYRYTPSAKLLIIFKLN